MPETSGAYTSLDALARLQYKAKGFSFLPRQPITSVLAGRHASRLRGRGLNFEEIRRYLPGDDVRTLDWKVTARLREPHVRVYTEERDRPAILLVDQRVSMFFGSQRQMKSVTAAEAAALGAWRCLDQGDRVGAIVFNDDDIVEIRPHRSRENVLRILREIVRKNEQLRVDSGVRENPTMLNRVFERAGRLVKHDYLVGIFSDAAGADSESVRHATALSQHNDLITVFIYDPLEQRLPNAGRWVVTEGENQLELNTSSRNLRNKFSEQFETKLSWLRQVSRQREIAILPLHTGEGVAEQAQRLLGHNPTARSS